MQPSNLESDALPLCHGSLSRDKKSGKKELDPYVNRTRNLLIWSQTHYHCTTNPLSICHSSFNTTQTVNYTQAKYTTQLSDLECVQPSDLELCHKSLSHDKKSGKQEHEPDVNRRRNLRIWGQTRYHCATDPLPICHSSSNASRTVNYTQVQYTTQISDLECTRPVNYAHAQYTIIEVKDVMLEKDRATF